MKSALPLSSETMLGEVDNSSICSEVGAKGKKTTKQIH